MSPLIAKAICAVWVGALFYLNRDKSLKTSFGLWIPVFWFVITGSRPLSMWLGIGGEGALTVDALDGGSPVDAMFFGSLTAAGIIILASRNRTTYLALQRNWPLLLYFTYCLVSVMWSDSPSIAFKRWVKALGDIVMALLVVTEAQPLAALRSLFSRVGFLLLPFSIICIKYIPEIGRGYDYWIGTAYYVGVTTNKNSLGATSFVLGLGALWQVLRLWPKTDIPNRSQKLIAQGMLLGVAAWLLNIANSATSKLCFVAAGGLMMILHMRTYKGRPRAVKTLVATVLVIGGVLQITGAKALLFQMIGRNADLTGRATEIWPALFRLAPNALLGAGFESFWTGARMQQLWALFPGTHLNESHNGYLEIYLNLGVVGLILLAIVFFTGYRTSLAALRKDPNGASLMLAYILVSLIYSYTEAGFRMLYYTWSFLILLVIVAGDILRSSEGTQTERTPQRVVDRGFWSPTATSGRQVGDSTGVFG